MIYTPISYQVATWYHLKEVIAQLWCDKSTYSAAVCCWYMDTRPLFYETEIKPACDISDCKFNESLYDIFCYGCTLLPFLTLIESHCQTAPFVEVRFLQRGDEFCVCVFVKCSPRWCQRPMSIDWPCAVSALRFLYQRCLESSGWPWRWTLECTFLAEKIRKTETENVGLG